MTRTDVKRGIMTIPYGASLRTITDGIASCLEVVDVKVNPYKKNKDGSYNLIFYYCSDNNNKSNVITSSDLTILSKIAYDIVMNDFERIRRLCVYLRNVCTLFNKLGLPTLFFLLSIDNKKKIM